MKNIKTSFNQPISNKLAVIVISVIALVLPIYVLHDTDWENIDINALSILLPLFYIVIVVGFIYLALGKQGKILTSKETDQKIENTYSLALKKLTPLWWALGIVWTIWMGYLIWALF